MVGANTACGNTIPRAPVCDSACARASREAVDARSACGGARVMSARATGNAAAAAATSEHATTTTTTGELAMGGALKGSDETKALLPTTMLASGTSATMTTVQTMDMTAYDHFSVLAWIATDTCWSQSSEWVVVPWALTATFFTFSVWLSRKSSHDFVHAWAVFFWLVGGNSMWMYQEFTGVNEIMRWSCVVCFSLAIALELGQMTICRLVEKDGAIDKRNLSNDFQAVAILSWAVHDLCEYMYFDASVSDALASAFLSTWWVMSVVIVMQQSYYLWVQSRALSLDPNGSGWDYALALWAWSIGCVIWGYGDIYLPNQHPAALFKLPSDPLNMRWYTFWVIMIGSIPLAIWCCKYLWHKITCSSAKSG